MNTSSNMHEHLATSPQMASHVPLARSSFGLFNVQVRSIRLPTTWLASPLLITLISNFGVLLEPSVCTREIAPLCHSPHVASQALCGAERLAQALKYDRRPKQHGSGPIAILLVHPVLQNSTSVNTSIATCSRFACFADAEAMEMSSLSLPQHCNPSCFLVKCQSYRSATCPHQRSCCIFPIGCWGFPELSLQRLCFPELGLRPRVPVYARNPPDYGTG